MSKIALYICLWIGNYIKNTCQFKPYMVKNVYLCVNNLI